MSVGAAGDWLRRAAQEAGDALPAVLREAPEVPPGGALALELFALLQEGGEDWRLADLLALANGFDMQGEGLLRAVRQVQALRAEYREGLVRIRAGVEG